MNAPPAQYTGTTTVSDSNFNSLTDTRQLDLAPDDDLTADFGAPTLLAVRPLPGAAGGSATVTGTVTTSAAAVTVKVNGVNAPVTGTSFSLGTTIGTGPLTIVARDNLGRTTTLKRYFTTITGLFAPAAGADLVSPNADLFASCSRRLHSTRRSCWRPAWRSRREGAVHAGWTMRGLSVVLGGLVRCRARHAGACGPAGDQGSLPPATGGGSGLHARELESGRRIGCQLGMGIVTRGDARPAGDLGMGGRGKSASGRIFQSR